MKVFTLLAAAVICLWLTSIARAEFRITNQVIGTPVHVEVIDASNRSAVQRADLRTGQSMTYKPAGTCETADQPSAGQTGDESGAS